MGNYIKCIQIFILISVNSLVFSGNNVCSQPSLKGIELNSWKSATGAWNFSLLMGTNRRKLITEITDQTVTIVGVDNLVKKLSKLQKGENVFWVNYAKEPAPKILIEKLSDYSKKNGINLHIVGVKNIHFKE